MLQRIRQNLDKQTKFNKIKGQVAKKDDVIMFKDYRDEEEEQHDLEEINNDSDVEMDEYGEEEFDEEIAAPEKKKLGEDDKLSAGFDDYGAESVDEDEEAMRKRLIEESDDEQGLEQKDSDDEVSDI